MAINFNLRNRNDLYLYSDLRMNRLKATFSRALHQRLKEKYGDVRTSNEARRLLGPELYDAIVNEEGFPPISHLIKLADILDVDLALVLTKSGYLMRSPMLKLNVKKKYLHTTLNEFMRNIYDQEQTRTATVDLRKFQEERLQYMERKSRIHWKSLIQYFAASFYEMELLLVERTPSA
ncbi:MAG: hypothetical protein JSS83_28285 [Cyanobacteria bacterium SZAS LIN-3]|nr:hypothetical protein [Cyanobacteria bacterium SZAS LIN-3]MBS2007357.1 hypothetical protein [Cyanobacteria bacterium SZAS TMP-1]